MSAPAHADPGDLAVQAVLRKLAVVWTGFEGRLEQTPLIRRLNRGTLTIQDYRAFLLNLRQQVVDGACWISRAASNVGEAHFELRSTLMAHATTEHRDFRLLEADYVAAGGRLDEIRGGRKNVGSEALSAWMFHEASRSNPFGLLGAMFIIEGLGSIKASGWGRSAKAQLGLPDAAVRFLTYHGDNDAGHMEDFAAMVRMVTPDAAVEARIVRCAEVTGRLYALQTEEIELAMSAADLAACAEPFDRRDPDPWLALRLDQSLPIDDGAKAALARGADSYSRAFLLPAIRPLVFVFFCFVHLFRRVFLTWPNANVALHRTIHWGLRTFCTPDANRLILRHFHVGTELLAFIKANAGPVEIQSVPLRPRDLRELEDNVFLQHDLNVYNFIIELNRSLIRQGRDLEPVARPDFSMLSDGFDIEETRQGPLNFVDIQTAVEVYTPLYALFLPRKDFVRASNSLQLDEVIGVYIGKILGTDYHLSFIKNGHPLVPLSTFQAGFRLMMHGLDCEAMHGWLQLLKRRQAAGMPGPARRQAQRA